MFFVSQYALTILLIYALLFHKEINTMSIG